VRHPDGRRTCAAVVVDRTGEARAVYAKQHLWGSHERALFAPGRAGATLVLDDWQLGLGVCYDGCFPEHARAAAIAGAHAYLCPSGYVMGSAHRRDIYYPARALDNTVYVAFANSVGGEAPWEFNGGAALYDPQGQPMARAADEGEAVVTAAFDPQELSRVRRAQTMLVDRLPSLEGPRWVIEV
jgi:predicted amidohydrolase